MIKKFEKIKVKINKDLSVKKMKKKQTKLPTKNEKPDTYLELSIDNCVSNRHTYYTVCFIISLTDIFLYISIRCVYIPTCNLLLNCCTFS